jgi:hypothetical protein
MRNTQQPASRGIARCHRRVQTVIVLRSENMTLRSLAITLFTLAAAPAFADCHWEWLCNGEGACKQMPVCDSLYDKAPPRPESAPPSPPPLRMRPQQLPGRMGTTSCEHVMRQLPSGRWQWDQACFCSDPAATADATTPIANLVRCQTPWKE